MLFRTLSDPAAGWQLAGYGHGSAFNTLPKSGSHAVSHAASPFTRSGSVSLHQNDALHNQGTQSMRATSSVPKSGAVGRRTLILPALAAALGSSTINSPAHAAGSLKLTTWTDKLWKSSLGVPEGWKITENESPDGNKITFFQDPNDVTNTVFLASQPVSSNQAGTLGSFGKIEAVAQKVLPSCNKGYRVCSFKEGDSSDVVLLSSEVYKQQSYLFDYTVEKDWGPGQGPLKKHLKTLYGLRDREMSASKILSQLYLVCREDKYAEMQPTYAAIIDSFQ